MNKEWNQAELSNSLLLQGTHNTRRRKPKYMGSN
jgi:hypothetical protein